MVWRHQSSPHLGAFLIESQYPVGVIGNNKVKPYFKICCLGQITAPPYVLEASPNLADGLYR